MSEESENKATREVLEYLRGMGLPSIADEVEKIIQTAPQEPTICYHCGEEIEGEKVVKVRAFHTSCPYKPTPGTEGEPDAQGELLDRIASQPLCNEIKPDAQGEDEFRMLAKEIFDGIFGGGLCEFDIADKIQALLQKQRPSVTRGEWMEISGYINRGEWTGVDLLVWLADKGIEVKD